MGVWTPIFRHQFLDGNPFNFDAHPGTIMSMLPDGPVIRPTPPRDQRGFVVRPGHKFHYHFDKALTEVIGYDIEVDVSLTGTAPQRFGHVALRPDPMVRFVMDFLDGLVRVQMFALHHTVGASVPITGDRVKLRARWHTHGQVHIFVNGELKAYAPDRGVGAAGMIDGVEFGHHADQQAAAAPQFLMTKVAVSVLRRDDAARLFDKLMPDIGPVPLDRACLGKMRGADQEAFGKARAFMSGAISRLTRPWSVGASDGPFSPESIKAHGAAKAAGIAFVKFLATRNPAHGKAARDLLVEMLAALKASDPAAFKQSFGELKRAAGAYDQTCLDQLMPAAEAHKERLTPILNLLEEIARELEAMGGDNG